MQQGQLFDIDEIPFDDLLRIYYKEVRDLYPKVDDILLSGLFNKRVVVFNFMSLKSYLDSGLITEKIFRGCLRNYFSNFLDYVK